MWTGLINRFTITIAAFVVATGGAYFKGRADGKAIAAGQLVKEIIADNKEWNNALSEAERLDAYNRCLAIGGLQDDCRVLMRDQ